MSEDGFTTPIRIWFANYTNKLGKVHINKLDGLLSNPTDLEVFDDVWQKLSLLMIEKAEHQFTMERVDELARVVSKEKNGIEYYVEMCTKMIDWLKIRIFFAGKIVCKHYGINEDVYCQFRDDTNDPNITRTFVEAATVEQIFLLPPKYKSLSKDISLLEDSQGTLNVISEVYSGKI